MQDTIKRNLQENCERNKKLMERRMRGMMANGVHKPFQGLRDMIERNTEARNHEG